MKAFVSTIDIRPQVALFEAVCRDAKILFFDCWYS